MSMINLGAYLQHRVVNQSSAKVEQKQEQHAAAVRERLRVWAVIDMVQHLKGLAEMAAREAYRQDQRQYFHDIYDGWYPAARYLPSNNVNEA